MTPRRIPSDAKESPFDRAAPLPPPRSREEFWADFKAHAALTNQEEVAPATARNLRGWHVVRVVLAGAAAVVALLALALIPSAGPGANGKSAHIQLSEVREVELAVQYDSMMILEDAEAEGTLLWIDGLQNAGNAEETS